MCLTRAGFLMEVPPETCPARQAWGWGGRHSQQKQTVCANIGEVKKADVIKWDGQDARQAQILESNLKISILYLCDLGNTPPAVKWNGNDSTYVVGELWKLRGIRRKAGGTVGTASGAWWQGGWLLALRHRGTNGTSLNSEKGPTGGELVCNISQSGPESVEADRKPWENFK